MEHECLMMMKRHDGEHPAAAAAAIVDSGPNDIPTLVSSPTTTTTATPTGASSLLQFDDMSSFVGTAGISAPLLHSLSSFEKGCGASSIPRKPLMSGASDPWSGARSSCSRFDCCSSCESSSAFSGSRDRSSLFSPPLLNTLEVSSPATDRPEHPVPGHEHESSHLDHCTETSSPPASEALEHDDGGRNSSSIIYQHPNRNLDYYYHYHPYHEAPADYSPSSRSSSANGTFLLAASSTSSIVALAPSDDDDDDDDDDDSCSRDSTPNYTTTTAVMPAKTLAEGLDQPDYYICNTTYMAANAASNVSSSTSNNSHWRPKSARSAQSGGGGGGGRSPSPLLFSRLTGRGKHQSRSGGQQDAVGAKQTAAESVAPHEVGDDAGAAMGMTADEQSRDESRRWQQQHQQQQQEQQQQMGSAEVPTAPALTRDEFEALPVAIQRKYFSTLERLRFAQGSGIVEGIYHHYDDISHQNVKRRRPRQDRSSSDYLAGRIRRRSLRGPRSPGLDGQWSSSPEKNRKRQYTREEQVSLAKNLRASVILDAADEAIYKIGRRACKTPLADLETPPPALSARSSMESNKGKRQPTGKENRQESVPESFYDSFRWLDEEDDLDLRLCLDDYHANLRESLPEPTKEMRPSFRRHLSISKIPFGRSSVSSSRPGTKDDGSAPPSPAVSSMITPVSAMHGRRRSRALSLITPKHAPSSSISTIDPGAAHYQDPEARLKLRVYLASPQKFDEAIEFGFPSTDALSATPGVNDGSLPSTTKQRLRHKSVCSEHMRTFLADDDDDDDRLDSDDEASAADPESPKTPPLTEKPVLRPVDPVYSHHKPTDSYAQAPAASREMTLRMTLTRPDLRADDDQIYGWQQQQQRRRSQTLSPFQQDDAQQATFVGEERSKESIERMLAGIDHWGPEPSDKGVMKRFWNRVRRT